MKIFILPIDDNKTDNQDKKATKNEKCVWKIEQVDYRAFYHPRWQFQKQNFLHQDSDRRLLEKMHFQVLLKNV